MLNKSNFTVIVTSFFAIYSFIHNLLIGSEIYKNDLVVNIQFMLFIISLVSILILFISILVKIAKKDFSNIKASFLMFLVGFVFLIIAIIVDEESLIFMS